ncbi:lysosomal alpha-mannosidase-like [Oppia nitens]|uniref:lysosomal alpha-mannosidase-like n=1 Tax=Oppia nitens TaxID=1686743 RepID=UPI0023DC2702|nr:lysosomal alpha-mannosidase-like [Oppia nitens]
MSHSIKLIINLIICLDIILIGYALHLDKRSNNEFCNPTKADKLNIHIISHTHLDAGWVKTYDGYYKDSVFDIFKTVIESLTYNDAPKERKFTFVEMCYFNRYWNDLNETQQELVRQLVTTGKLQFTSGGWVMNDEASPHYAMIIDQMSYGHRFINQTFGRQYVPTTGWQIDPFGHTREYASILSQMGFNALLNGRIDYQDKQKRMTDKSMEFIWITDPNLKTNNYLFSGITPSGYYPTDGVSLNYNYRRNAPFLERRAAVETKGYRTNHLMATMGGDFNYYFAEFSFKNLDQLIDFMNKNHSDIHLLYSTPDCYVRAVYESHTNWTDYKFDDFMPYADRFNDYWSGYFTSRPAFKYLMNYAYSVLQSAKQLIALTGIYSEKSKQLIKPLEESVGIGLHHDAISGTSKQFVSDDYVRMLSRGLAYSDELIAGAYQKLFGTHLKPHFCHQLNVSDCKILAKSENSSRIEIAIYNPLAHDIQRSLQLPLVDNNYKIVDENGKEIEYQISLLPEFIQLLSERKTNAKYELLFNPVLKGLTFSRFYLQNVENQSNQKQFVDQKSDKLNEEVTAKYIHISNDEMNVTIDVKTGLLAGVEYKDSFVSVRQNFGYYTRGRGKPSGAYSMHTNGSDPVIIAEKANITVRRGKLSEEVLQEFTPWLKQIIRVYKNMSDIEFEWIVGPLPRDKDYEIISRFDTGFKTEGVFYTDSNGRQTLKRKRNYRETWNLETTELVASNYYPVTAWISIKDQLSDLQMTVLPDRTQGGSSLKDGSVELMIHRRLHNDDGYGMEEKLDEPGVDNNGLVVKGKHKLLISRIEDNMRELKIISKTIFWQPLLLFVDLNDSLLSKTTENNNKLVVNPNIGPSIHLLTLEQLDEDLLFIRLENIFGTNETIEKSVSVTLNNLFVGIELIDVTETGLTGTQSVEYIRQHRYRWSCGDICLSTIQLSIVTQSDPIFHFEN